MSHGAVFPAGPPPPPPLWRVALGHAGLLLVLLLALPFIVHSAGHGGRFLDGSAAGASRLHAPGAPATNLAIAVHMLGGAAITTLAVLQLAGAVRRRLPGLHRAAGRALVALALLTAAGGFAFILGRGTIGGWPMDAAFALYGTLLAVAAVETLRHARARRLDRHRDWALRLAMLSLGSWLYRVHYTLWWIATDGLWTAPDFTGAFDRVQLLAFFLPYLLLVEIWLRLRRRQAAATQGTQGAQAAA